MPAASPFTDTDARCDAHSEALSAQVAALPDDPTLLKHLLDARLAEIERLKLLVAKLKHAQFGRRSERLGAFSGQLDLGLSTAQQGGGEARGASVDLAALAEVIPIESAARHPGRNRLPDHLPRSRTEHLPGCSDCPQCGGALKHLGEDVSEELEYVPARFRVVRHVRPKFACGRCDAIVQAPALSRPIASGLPGPGLLAHVLTAKYCDHLPLYRKRPTAAVLRACVQRGALISSANSPSSHALPMAASRRTSS